MSKSECYSVFILFALLFIFLIYCGNSQSEPDLKSIRDHVEIELRQAKFQKDSLNIELWLDAQKTKYWIELAHLHDRHFGSNNIAKSDSFYMKTYELQEKTIKILMDSIAAEIITLSDSLKKLDDMLAK